MYVTIQNKRLVPLPFRRNFKEIVHPNYEYSVIPNSPSCWYKIFRSSEEHTLKNVGNQTVFGYH